MLVEVRVPLRRGAGSAYEKVERRRGDWAVAAAGASVSLSGGTFAHATIALTAVGGGVTEPAAGASLVGQPPSDEAFARRRRPRRRGLLAHRRPARLRPLQAPPGPGADAARPARRHRPRPARGGLMQITMTINGEEHSRDVEPRTLLVHFLRDDLDLTGTHWGCDTSNCGACVVLMDGEPVKSCTVLAATAAGHEIGTVEGLERDGRARPVQQGFIEKHGLQCGFCTPA
jgi:xanthine dehydrogenase iron-sulfur cluster and FAD-binding subunit A